MEFQQRSPNLHNRHQQKLTTVEQAYPNWQKQEPVYIPEKNRNNVFINNGKML